MTTDLELHILELPKIRREGIGKTELIKWLKFIDNPKSKEVEEYMKENVAIKEANEKLDKMLEDEHLRKIAEWREMAIIEENSMKKSAYRKGREEGENKNKIETAKKLKKLNVDIEIIVQSTGLTREEVDKF